MNTTHLHTFPRLSDDSESESWPCPSREKRPRWKSMKKLFTRKPAGQSFEDKLAQFNGTAPEKWIEQATPRPKYEYISPHIIHVTPLHYPPQVAPSARPPPYTLNSMLRHNKGPTAINWNMATMSVSRAGRGSPLTNRDGERPATSPPCTSMRIRVPEFARRNHRWTIRVLPGTATGTVAELVSVADVIFCVHTSLHKLVSKHHYDALSMPEKESVFSWSYLRRMAMDDIETRHRRVDYLEGQSLFDGINPEEDGTWTLFAEGIPVNDLMRV